MSNHPNYAMTQPHPLGTQFIQVEPGKHATLQQPAGVAGEEQQHKTSDAPAKESAHGGVTGVQSKDVRPSARRLEEMRAASAHKDDSIAEDELKTRDIASEVHRPTAVYALRVLDPLGASVVGVDGGDVADQDVGWLRSRVQEHLNKVGPHPPNADQRELCLYQQWGEWLQDSMKLVHIMGDTVHFTLYSPHGSASYNVYLRCLPAHLTDRILTVSVRDSDTILQVKTKVADQYQIAAVNQRMLFGGRMLDDERTLGSLKIPAEATLELDVLNL